MLTILLIRAACLITFAAIRRACRSSNPFYRGQLTEFNVLGIELKDEVCEADIHNAMASKPKLSLMKGSSMMLIQSGAMIPDDVMV